MRKYCEECGSEVDTKIILKKETYEVCGESIEVNAQILVCENCGEELFCEELDQATLIHAYNEYRRRHKLLFPDEIKNIREQYGLSQRSFAKLLNWGDKTIHRYENGSIQDKAHNSILLLLREPENMKRYLLENEVLLEEKQKIKLLNTIRNLEEHKEQKLEKKYLKMLFSNEPSIENGFKSFDYEKLCAMVLYFAHKCKGLLKVKLLKLLNYADMIFYKENGVSMSGIIYVHLTFGPVPQKYNYLFGMMESDQVAHIEVVFENGYEKHQVIPDVDVPQGVLTEEEIEILNRVYNRFEDFGSVEISNYSHKEKGYSSTKKGEVISYEYAKDIDLYQN